MDNLRDVVDDILRRLDDHQEGQRDLQEGQRDLQEGQRDLQEGQRDLQEGQRDLQEGQRDLQEGQRDLQEGQRDLQEGQPVFQRHLEELRNRIDDLESAVRVLQETFAEVIRSHDDQKMEQDLFNDILANLQDTPDKALHESVRRQERRVESLELTPAFRSVTLADLERRCMGHMKRQLDTNQESVRRQERRIESIEHTLELRNVALAVLEEYVRQQEFSSYDGQLLWKISDYARRRNDAVTRQQLSLYSPCFFTSRYGYKMCARLYLNGDGMGRGTHISLFIVVMRGEHDALLRWPFKQKVTFMLLDQDNVEHVIDAFRPDLTSSSFQRPRRETNIASGCPMFCPLAELNNHAYVRDDTMFVKIIVDTSDL